MTTRSWNCIDKSGNMRKTDNMPYRVVPFVNDQIYHIYNRGNEKRVVFEDKYHYRRFLKTLIYYQLKGPKPKLSHFFKYQRFKTDTAQKLVDILAYCLMPNHFHLLVKQKEEGGITEMMTKLILSYTKYFNTKHNRVGALFQGQFKAVLIESDEQLTHVSRYIHLNPIVSLLVKDLEAFSYSSYEEYVQQNRQGICSTKEVLGFFKSPDDYARFVHDQINYGLSLEKIKHQIIEEL